MPVPTDTFYNIRRLNLIFVVCAAALFGATLWLVVRDNEKEWRAYQRASVAWDTAMTRDAQLTLDSAEHRRRIEELERAMAQKQEALPLQEIAQLEAKMQELLQEKNRISLPAAAEKGEIGPLIQQIERAKLDPGADPQRVAMLEEQLAATQGRFKLLNDRIVAIDRTVAQNRARIRDLRAALSELEKQRANDERELATARERLSKLQPTGPAALMEFIRNKPLLDWFNPSERVQQVVVNDVRTDLNFLTVETVDRCASCHINISDPRFERGELTAFLERQLAQMSDQDVTALDRPVVMVEFWMTAAGAVRQSHRAGPAIDELVKNTLASVNAMRASAGLPAVADAAGLVAELNATLTRPATEIDGKVLVTARQWQEPARFLVDDLRSLLRQKLGDEEFAHLSEFYRVRLTERYNELRKGEGLAMLDPSPVLLAHPRLDLYVESESKHPMKTMGCTACHEGSGQETMFEHTVHTPREVWVDRQTGSPVPAALIRHLGSEGEIEQRLRASVAADQAQVLHASTASQTASHDAHQDSVGTTHDDVKLTDPSHPAPFAPAHDTAAAAAYLDPAGDPSLRMAVKQKDYWNKKYHWYPVTYMHWEKPMHSLEYVESSCNKCHTEVFDLVGEAPRLFEGRRLFAKLGCVNCHSVEDLKDDLDIKKVGPSLVHVKEKLSPQMLASWTWSPKAFRPLTRMPHFFMLENNSAPVDILRTRVETTAITHYLMSAKPPEGTPALTQEAPPQATGDAVRGRALFNQVGCLSCHSNMSEHGEKWITQDLVKRQGLSKADAQKQYDAWTYNERHTYAKEHLASKVDLVGPELSGVGTKLLAHRTELQARTWTYNWLRQPHHYSSYTVMPSFRLDETDANDLTAYLLSLKRPDDYQVADFGFDEAGKPTRLSDDEQKMLTELVVLLQSAGATPEMVRPSVQAMPVDEKLAFLGSKMIGHYGCNGCHGINGFENATSACTNLDDWGLKDPHKLDFGYFDQTFERQREKPITVWKVSHEGLSQDATQITPVPDTAHPGASHTAQRDVAWEHMALERRPWLYHKLHNTRVYDRGRQSLEGDLASLNPGRPYDKLKMPKFFLKDEQVHALVAYVTSVRKPLVSESLQRQAITDRDRAVVRGRELATLYNCYGCHNVEGNDVSIQEFYGVFNDDGSTNYAALVNAPPRLVGQGSKTQPDWLVYFLQNVHPVRPWLRVRMPSFFSADQAHSLPHSTQIADYFAAWAQQTSQRLGDYVQAVDNFNSSAPPNVHWSDAPRLASVRQRIASYATHMELATDRELDPRQSTDDAERRANWDRVVKDMRFLAKTYDVAYPFNNTLRPEPDAERFARGEALFNELRCYQCHAFGDDATLIKLFDMKNPPGSGGVKPAAPAAPAVDDEYGEEDSTAAPATPQAAAADDEGYGEETDDGYGEEETPAKEKAQPAVELPPAITHPALSNYTAPNLTLTARRLQWNWSDATLQAPALTISKSAQMPQWFPDGDSAFAKYPGSLKDEKHALFGYTGQEQRDVLLDFLYASGLRRYTPGSEKLSGQEAPKVELKPLPKPATTPTQPTGDTPATQQPQAGDGPIPGSQPAPTPDSATPTPAPVATTIELIEGPTAPYTGPGAHGQKTRVVGLIKFEGRRPRPRVIDMSADRFCVGEHSEPVVDDLVAVNEDGSMRNVFIEVVSEVPAASPPAVAAIVDQVGCVYIPRVLGVMAGQEVEIHNSDNTLHNVHFRSAANGEFNIGMPVKGMVEKRRFAKPERDTSFKCDVHPWMGSRMHVMPHPFFAVSDRQGRFEILGLPPGKHTLQASHESERIPPVTFDVEVLPDQTTRADATLK